MDPEEARKQRGLNQKLYLLEENQVGTTINYVVLGSTNNCYDITFVKNPRSFKWTCSCPDHQRRRKICKHIYFCKDKVLGSSENKWEEAEKRIQSTLINKSKFAPNQLIELY
jgi:hypothetical protein